MLKGQLTARRRPRHLAGRQLLPLLEGQQVPGLRPRRRRRRRRSAARAPAPELRRHGVRPPGPEAVVRHRRLHAPTARASSCRAPLRPLAAAARRLGADEPHERRRHEERDSLPLRAHRAARSGARPAVPARRPAAAVGGGGGAARATIDLSKPVTLSAYGEWTKKAGLLRAGERPAPRNRVRGRVVQQSGEGGEGRHVPVHAPDVRRVPRPARVGPGLQGRRRRSPTPIRSSPNYLWGHRILFDFKDQRRPPAAGHPRAPRRLQAGREAADARELLREELAEPASLHRRRRT